MHALASRHGARFLLLIVPSRHALAEDRYSASSLGLLRRAEARARALEIPYVIPEAALRDAGGAELYMDFCHPTAEGNAVIARALAPIIGPW